MNQNEQSLVLLGDIIGLDLGMSRTGVARMSTMAKIVEPLNDIAMDDKFVAEIENIVRTYSAVAVVVGLPRGLDGQETEQTKWVRMMIDKLETGLGLPVFSVDEAGTTKEAEKRAFDTQSIDSVSAGIILEDFTKEIELGKIPNVSF